MSSLSSLRPHSHEPLDVLDVASFLMAIADREDDVTNLKLQKLCYYAQGMHLALFGTPLFDESLLAWKEGPVVRSLWNKYQYTNAQTLKPPPEFKEDVIPSDAAAFLRRVYEQYGQFSPWKLRDMTHDEPPYKEAKAAGRTVLDRDTMQQFFEEVLSLQLAEQPRLGRDQLRVFLQQDSSVKEAIAEGRADFVAGRYQRL